MEAAFLRLKTEHQANLKLISDRESLIEVKEAKIAQMHNELKETEADLRKEWSTTKAKIDAKHRQLTNLETVLVEIADHLKKAKTFSATVCRSTGTLSNSPDDRLLPRCRE